MSAYRYRASRQDGVIVAGMIDAASAGEATLALAGRGLHPLDLAASTESRQLLRRVPRRDLALVFRSLATLVSAGVPLDRALLSTLEVAHGPLLPVLANARQGLHQGRSLSQSLEEAGSAIPELVTGLLRAGERAGRLSQGLEEAAAHLDREAELAGKVRQALAYPLLLAGVGTLIIIVISTIVVPRFAQLLNDAGQQLPFMTQALLAVSSLMTEHIAVLLSVSLVLTIGLLEWRRRPTGALVWERLLLNLPILGTLRHELATARFCRALGAGLETGLPLLPALDSAKAATGNHAVMERIEHARELVSQGASLHASLHTESAIMPGAL
ncbi:MAG: type II secretion system F family protein, partial [Gemmatimonadales bacterium]